MPDTDYVIMLGMDAEGRRIQQERYFRELRLWKVGIASAVLLLVGVLSVLAVGALEMSK
jgi:hypothetical protein